MRGRWTVRQVSITKATVETDDRRLRRHSRRINGNPDMEPQVQRTGAGMLLALNLKSDKYVHAVYGSMERMAQRFSKVKPESLKAAIKLMTGLE